MLLFHELHTPTMCLYHMVYTLGHNVNKPTHTVQTRLMAPLAVTTTMAATTWCSCNSKRNKMIGRISGFSFVQWIILSLAFALVPHIFLFFFSFITISFLVGLTESSQVVNFEWTLDKYISRPFF